MNIIFLFFLILFPCISWGDSNSSNAPLLIEEQNGTNAGRYRTLQFSNGTTTNNNDGSIFVNNSSGGGGGWTLTDGVNTVTGVTNLTVTGGTVGGSTPNATLLITGGSSTNWTNVNTTDVDLPGGNVGIGTTFTNRAALTVMNGNVGIGTWVPNNALQIIGTLSATAVQTNGSSTQMTLNGFTSSAGYTSTFGYTANPASLTSGGAFSGTSSSNNFTGNMLNLSYTGTNSGNMINVGIGTQGTGTALKIIDSGTGPAITTTGGNVGIGTSAPRQQLDVAGTLNLGAPFVVTAAGNVGVGTVNPGSLLAIGSGASGILINGTGIASMGGTTNQSFTQGNISMNGFSNTLTNFNSTSGTSLTLIGGSVGNSGIVLQATRTTGTNDTIRFVMNNTSTEAMRIIDSGNVGIGSVNPGQALDVKGTIRITASTGTLVFQDGTSQSTAATSTPPASPTSSVQFNAGGGAFGGSAGFVFITPNVGINSTSPGQLLDVFGTTRSTQFVANGMGTISATFPNNVGIGSTTPQASLDLGTTGTLTSHRTTGIGWSEHNATNQACNTTCGSSACVVGLDIGTVGVANSGFVACTDATADDCICAGP